MTIKNMILGLSMFLVLSLNATVSSEVSTTRVHSAQTIACGHAMATAINAVNALGMGEFCTLNNIMINESLSPEQKWTAISSTPSLAGYYTLMGSAATTLITNGFFSMSAYDQSLVEQQTAIDLGIAIANVGCNGYHIAINSCLNQNAVCVVAAISTAFTGCLPCVALGLTACSAVMIDCGNNASSAYPGCSGQSGSLAPNPIIKPFSYIHCQS